MGGVASGVASTGKDAAAPFKGQSGGGSTDDASSSLKSVAKESNEAAEGTAKNVSGPAKDTAKGANESAKKTSKDASEAVKKSTKDVSDSAPDTTKDQNGSVGDSTAKAGSDAATTLDGPTISLEDKTKDDTGALQD